MSLDEAQGFFEVFDEGRASSLGAEECSRERWAGGFVGLVRQGPLWEVVVDDGAAGYEDEIAAVIEGPLGAGGAHDVARDPHPGFSPREIGEEIDEHLTGVKAYLYPGVEAADDQIEVVDQVAFEEDGDRVAEFGQVGVPAAEGESQSDVESGPQLALIPSMISRSRRERPSGFPP